MGYQNGNNPSGTHLIRYMSSPTDETLSLSSTSLSSFNNSNNTSSSNMLLVDENKHPKKQLKKTGKSSGTSSSEDSNKSSLLGAYANLVNTIVGAGVIGIPYAIKETGLVTGVILIFLVALFTDKSLRLLVEMGRKVNVSSYENLMETAFGYTGFVFITLNMLIVNYGALICYLLIIKDTIPTLLFGITPPPSNHLKGLTLFASSLIIIVPLSLQKDMADLSKTSTISVFFDLLMVLIIAIFSPVRESIAQAATTAAAAATATATTATASEPLSSLSSLLFFEGTEQAETAAAAAATYVYNTDSTSAAPNGLLQIIYDSIIFPKTVFVGLGVLSFAFACQDSSFLIAESLQNPTKKRWHTVTRSALLTCSGLSIIIGVTGYIGFRDQTEGNILNNFSSRELLLSPASVLAANIARGLLGSTMFCVYPLASYIARHSLLVLLFPTITTDSTTTPNLNRNHNRNKKHEDRNRIIITLVLYVAAIIPALLFDDVGIVLSVTGAIGGSCLSYLGPGAVYLGIHGASFLQLVTNYYNNNHAIKFMWRFPPTEETVSNTIDIDHTHNTNTLYCGNSNGKNHEHYPYFENSPLLLSSSKINTTNKKTTTTHIKVEEETMDTSTTTMDQQYCQTIFCVVSWYILAMPIWCWIATAGMMHQRYRQNSNQENKKKSNINNNNNINNNINNNNTIDEEIQRQKITNHQNSQPVDEAPRWTDYILAMTYMIIGVIALTAGLVSVFVS